MPGREKLLLSMGHRSLILGREIWERGRRKVLESPWTCRDRAHLSLINNPKVVLIQQVGSISRGTCHGEKGYFEGVGVWALAWIDAGLGGKQGEEISETSLNPGEGRTEAHTSKS